MSPRFSLPVWLLVAALSLAPTRAWSQEEGGATTAPTANEATETSDDKATDDDRSKEPDTDKTKAEEAEKELSPAQKRAADRAKRRAEEAEKVRYAWFKLDGALPESPGAAGPFGDLSVDLRKQIARIDAAAADDKIQGLVLRIDSPTLGSGQRNEVRQAIARFRAKGKHAVAVLEAAEAAGYLVACACDEIVMPESGFLLLPGVRAEPMFYKGLLAKAGVKADFIHVGDAKGAAEPYTRREWSEPVKANITSLIDDMYEQMVDTIAMDRPMKRGAVVAAIDRGLLTATQALEAGLVDRLAYEGDLRDALKKRHDTDTLAFVENYGKQKVDTDFSGPAGFFKLMGMIASGGKKSSGRGDKIAVVYAVGPIATGESKGDLFGSANSIGSTTMIKALRDAADDDRVKAIVLRVDSPGGSAVASDLIWSQIQRIEKPVVASMGNVAASGGYYISMGCDHVFAEPATVTGSIGVVGGKMAVGGLLEKLGVTTDLIARGKNSGLFSVNEKFTESERDVLQSLMDDTYEQFTAKAAKGRGLSQDRIKELGGGRVYTGRQAERLELIDELGDLRSAVSKAKSLAGLAEDDEVTIDTYPEAEDFFESLFGDNDEQREVRVRLDLGGVLPELEEAVRRTGWVRQLFAKEPIGLVMPYDLRIE
ncbi:Protease 4 [Botrimarina colliarenosi]|uniref:Protease 4 n=1 Tax=Botrimarina colliarenosi TaxID=2528001 RepID=A0A5C6ABE5_9BACT|nr:signal peptide peptidase SppA [Botrimarina colliarenosi]TWT96608.1 Protease 4 [Botrimarina colliarenosi]